MQTTSILEIHFPVESLVIKPNLTENTDQTPETLKHELVIDCTPESTAQLLALAVDHIDILLEDWYPTLGTRFVHTSEGKFLVTRLVPCPKCLALSSEIEQQMQNNSDQAKNLSDVLNNPEADFGNYGHRIRKSQESYTSECDSGVGPDSNESSRMPSVEGYPGISLEESSGNNTLYYSWMVEECILAAYNTKTVACPVHFDVPLSRVAPDTVSHLHVHFFLNVLLITFEISSFL